MPADFTVDPASVLAGGWLSHLTFVATNGWIFTVDTSRSVQQGPTADQYVIPVLVTKGTDTSLGTTVTPHLDAAPISYSGPTSDGKQPGATETVAVVARQGSYVDVQFRPSTGSFTLDLGTLGDEITFAGFGGTGVTVVPGGVTDLGGGLYRFLLTGTFRPGQVDVVLHYDNFGDTSARGPPAGSTETQSFLVTGSTGDVARTAPSTPTTPREDDRPVGRRHRPRPPERASSTSRSASAARPASASTTRPSTAMRSSSATRPAPSSPSPRRCGSAHEHLPLRLHRRPRPPARTR